MPTPRAGSLNDGVEVRSPGVDHTGRQPLSASSALHAGVDALLSKLRSDRWRPAPGHAGRSAPETTREGNLHWCAELEGDSILSSEYLLMKWILGQENDTPSDVVTSANGGGGHRARLERISEHLRQTQRDDGTWGQYPGSGPDVSACVKAYFALKLMGDSPGAPHMRRARERVLELGGAEKCNTFSTFYLACLGQVSWNACPAIPPEIALLPRWFPFHLDKVAAWTRTMILPLALCSAIRPVRRLEPSQGIDELFVDQSCRARLNQPWDQDEVLGWRNTFLMIDRLLKLASGSGGGGGAGGRLLAPVRERAIRAAEAWILKRLNSATTEGLGAIFPPMVYVQIAFKALGYPRSHPVMRQCEKDLDDFMIDQPASGTNKAHVRIQPCFSPVWDTGIALYSLTEAGLTAASDPSIARVCDWLRERQVRMNGDWARNLRPEHASIQLGDNAAAWAFEYRNDWYPDSDDTAMVAKALWRAGDRPGETLNRDLARKACRWLVAMQNDDGGWAAFDRTRDRQWMEAVPFADHNAMQDPSCADITGRALEALVTCGIERDDPAVVAGVKYVLEHQKPQGCWFGRWGVNYLYGTWQALGGLTHAGVPCCHPAIRRAIDWVQSVQNDDGGFGESVDTYLDPSLMGRGESTASQTAWGLMCLMYALPVTHKSVRRAAQWLAEHQLASDKPSYGVATCAAGPATRDSGSERHAAHDFSGDIRGSWNEHLFTGTGFPKVFYLRYHYYRHYFPVMALARFVRLGGEPGATASRP
jgi:squalene-hopene/tetraprenyl-beta-curcumene cyclase